LQVKTTEKGRPSNKTISATSALTLASRGLLEDKDHPTMALTTKINTNSRRYQVLPMEYAFHPETLWVTPNVTAVISLCDWVPHIRPLSNPSNASSSSSNSSESDAAWSTRLLCMISNSKTRIQILERKIHIFSQSPGMARDEWKSLLANQGEAKPEGLQIGTMRHSFILKNEVFFLVVRLSPFRAMSIAFFMQLEGSLFNRMNFIQLNLDVF